MKVKECMNNNVCCVTPNSNITDACKLMGENHIGCVPVCDEQNTVVGIITDRDIILRSIACDKDAKQTPVSDIMSCNVCCCSPEDELENAEQKMCDSQIRRIPVVDNNKIVGILTLGDLAHTRQINKEEKCNTLEKICCSDAPKNAE